MTLLARAGKIVVCDNGHHICNVATDLNEGDALSFNQFTAWQAGTPDPAAPLMTCPLCGSWRIRFGLGGPVITTAAEPAPPPPIVQPGDPDWHVQDGVTP